ncbi:MAG: 4'-phosphopantetheinyl transferase family protein, partial [Bacteroidia bacterium]
LLNSLPVYTKEKLSEYPQKEERLRGAVGRLILKKLLIEDGYQNNILEKIKSDKYGRPYLDNKIDFNIAHSGDYIVCAISKNTKLGVDIEKIRPIEIDEFNILLTKKELKKIQKSNSPYDIYFDLFTQKEAVSKAIGIGLEISLPDIDIKKNVASCGTEKWNLAKLEINKKYPAHIAYKGKPEIQVKEIKIADLLNTDLISKII